MFQFLPVEWHDTLPSTNTDLIARVKRAPETPSGTVVAARTQTAGRGRQGRRWETAPGRNLTFSFLWNAPLPPERLPSMAQAIAVGIATFLNREGIEPEIKWPNDVRVQGKKISGILCEVARSDAEGPRAIVAGIGLNVNMTAEEAAAIDQPATSLALETRTTWAVGEVLERLLDALTTPLNAWGTEGFPGIQAAYTALAPPAGTRTRLRDGDRYVEGHYVGTDTRGALRLRLDDGAERVLYTGDIHTG